MALPDYRRTANIRLTVQERIGGDVTPNALTVSTVDTAGNPLALTVPVYHDYLWGDPDSARDPAASPEQLRRVMTDR